MFVGRAFQVIFTGASAGTNAMANHAVYHIPDFIHLFV
jgi:hypothetical protein